ncbi:hydrophobin-like protein [Zymoseptoria tritici IPO323]|uniref:Hydrophobin-like protein n=1 Tax=Zymoseptoria tritici (strain CBS 115943 / IPO323) TaxID=336722 RepID=F9XJS4_ZYMTI|nr:hydrophobin-like protein [Zymoseptoria tritici IPO323]EGP84238.1 hydrophobin-like protein [Zymoseptoria tritici IPO323]
MQIHIFATFFFASMAVAMPADSLSRRADFYLPCGTGLSATAECCSANLDGLLELNCAAVPKTPTSGEHFVAICAAQGQEARCCLTVVLGQGVKCQTPPGA